MSPLRKTALAAGVLYILTFVSIPTLFLYGPVKGANYILGPGPDTNVIVGGMLELIVALAGIGTAVALSRCSRGRTKGSRWASSARASWKPPPSSLASRSSCPS